MYVGRLRGGVFESEKGFKFDEAYKNKVCKVIIPWNWSVYSQMDKTSYNNKYIITNITLFIGYFLT